MSIQRIPLFQEGSILTHDMLNVLKEYSIYATELAYEGYSDGVIKGCEISAAEGVLTIGKGMIRIRSRNYYLFHEVSIVVEKTNHTKVVAIRAAEEEKSTDFLIRDIQILVEDLEDVIPGDLELCRFQLQEGAKLRTEYTDFSDMNTLYDTVCLINADWSGYETPTLAYPVLRFFREQALKYAVTNMEDKLFLNEIALLNGTSMNVKAINQYLAWKLDQEYTERPMDEIFEGLKEALSRIRTGKGTQKTGRMASRQLIVE